MDDSLEGRRLLITGATSGIGRALSLAAAGAGAHLILVARGADRIGTLTGGIAEGGGTATGIAADLSTEEGLRTVVEAVGQGGALHGLVHSAGACVLGGVEDTDAAALDLNWKVNLRAPYLLTSALLPALRATEGHVIFMNSGAGRVAKAGWSAYAASKHGLKALADALRDEVSGAGIRVTTIYPGRTASPMQASVHEQEGKAYDPSRFVRPEDVARVALAALVTAPPALVDEISVRPMPHRPR